MVSSCGGHFMELLQLIPAVEGQIFYIVTDKNTASESILKEYRYYYLIQEERKKMCYLFKFAHNIVASLFYSLKECPDVIISTGAGASYSTCRLEKWLGKKHLCGIFCQVEQSIGEGKILNIF